MSLAIVAPQSISELKEMVQSTFSSIPNNPERAGIPPEESWAGISPFVPGTSIIPGQKNIVEIVPVADLRQVTLTWPINFHSKEEKKIHLATKPDFYVSHLVGHEGPNSLLSYLKKQGWANGVGASNDADMSDFYTFEVTVSLTTKGLNAVDNVIESVLSYIKMLRDDPIPQYIFQEVLQLSELDWRFLTKGGPTSYVQSLVKSMKEYPESLYVAGPRRLALEESDSKLLSNNKPRSGFTSDEQLEKTIRTTSTLVSKLTIDDALITVLSKTFSGKTKRKEKWYGTDYNVKPIPIKNLNQWKNCAKATNIGMAYPPPNVFIPSESGLRVKKPVKINDKPQKLLSIEERLKPISPPKVIRDDGEEGRWTVHFKQDDTFGQPKSFAIFQLLTKEVFKNPMSASLAQLYQVSANDKLKEYAYDAGLAGLSYDIQVLPRGVRLSFGGYSEKLLDFATYVTEKLSQDVSSLLPEDEDDFDRYKDEIVRALAGFDVQQPYAHAIYYSSLVFQPKSFLFTNAELRDSIKKATRGDLTEYAKGLWASGKAEGLLQGNIDQPEALQFVEVIDKTLSFGTIKPSEIPPRFKPLSLPVTEGNSPPVKISISEPNSSNKNAAAQVTYQCLDTSEKSHIVIDIISSILSERFYEDLRTKQQVRYPVVKLFLKV
jgi:insulysin